MKAHGSTDEPCRPTADERFDIKWRLDPKTGCHIWQGTLTGKAGYGGFHYNGRPIGAHVYAYVRKHGPVPVGMELDHIICSRRACVNPDHLKAVTHQQNSLRCDSPPALHARQTHCIRNHEFTPENTYIRPDNGGRVCRTCSTLRESRRRAGRRNKHTTP